MLNNNLIQKISIPTASHLGISVSVLRLDKLHPIVSGNKIFKLNHYIDAAVSESKKELITFGGAFSNHLVATAFAAFEKGINTLGYIRGEKPVTLSPTLKDCIAYGMQIQFVERSLFDELQKKLVVDKKEKAVVVPYGGFGRFGAMGAKEILNFDGNTSYNIIVASCGSGTMGAGLLAAMSKKQKLILVSAVKNNYSIKEELLSLLLPEEYNNKSFEINHDYHFGGFAKKNNILFTFMNQFYQSTSIPTDFVYTGKLMYAFHNMLENGIIPEGSNVLLIHSGGLQGNRSLENKELIF